MRDTMRARGRPFTTLLADNARVFVSFFGSRRTPLGVPTSHQPASIIRPELQCELIEKDYLIGSGLGDGTPMIQCANDSYRLLDLRCVDPFKTEHELMNVPDVDTPMYSKSKFYEMFVLLRKQGYRVDFFDWSDHWKPSYT